MSILVATPCYGNTATAAYLRSALLLVSAFERAGMKYDWSIPSKNDSLIQRARNVITRGFLDTEFERLFFIDADIEFTPDDVAKLWNMDTDIAVGIYPMKRLDRDWYAAWHKGELVQDLDRFTGPIEVDYAGTGFMMIHRRVFEKMKEAWPEKTHAESDYQNCFLWFDPRLSPDGWYMSEDYAFCVDARSLGFKIMADPSVRLIHHGTHGFGRCA